MSKDTDRLLGHADEADGIEEYDNPLPDWWVGLFIVTILWAAYHFSSWHVFDSKSQAALYDQEVAQAAITWPELGKKAAFDDSPETLALGEEVYTSTCGSCHGADLRGGIGVNLVDSAWVHGGSFDEIAHTITEGVAAKGMPQWGPILGPKKVAAVASYVLSKNTGEAPTPKAEGSADAAPADGAAAAAADGPPDGQAVFTKNCVACHMADMTGGIGPNLVDDEWIHGGELAQITNTIVKGVPAKGMVSWKGILTDDEITAVAQFVYDKSHAE